MVTQAKGRKNDGGKIRFSLLPLQALIAEIEVLEYGAKKYDTDNWQKVPGARERYYDAAMRHLFAWKMGDKNDDETGLNHLAHAACCIHFLLWFDMQDNTDNEQVDLLKIGQHGASEVPALQKKPLKVYIACPMTSIPRKEALEKSIIAAQTVMNAGHIAVNPVLSFYHNDLIESSYNDWMDYDLKLVNDCDILFRIEGESKGADMECEYAKSLNKPVYYDLSSLLKYLKAYNV